MQPSGEAEQRGELLGGSGGGAEGGGVGSAVEAAKSYYIVAITLTCRDLWSMLQSSLFFFADLWSTLVKSVKEELYPSVECGLIVDFKHSS
jgi:hypothetical protein